MVSLAFAIAASSGPARSAFRRFPTGSRRRRKPCAMHLCATPVRAGVRIARADDRLQHIGRRWLAQEAAYHFAQPRPGMREGGGPASWPATLSVMAQARLTHARPEFGIDRVMIGSR